MPTRRSRQKRTARNADCATSVTESVRATLQQAPKTASTSIPSSPSETGPVTTGGERTIISPRYRAICGEKLRALTDKTRSDNNSNVIAAEIQHVDSLPKSPFCFVSRKTVLRRYRAWLELREALIAAGRDKPKFGSLFVGSAVFGIRCTFAALAPGYWCRRCSGGHWCCGLDTYQRNQQYDAAFDRACHARPSHGPSLRCRAWRYADRSSDRGLGGKPFRPPGGHLA
jgi:hypothetical protein